MKKIFTTLSILFVVVAASTAQSHNLQAGSNCRFAKNRCTGSVDCLHCEACNKKNEEEKKAKKTEDQKRLDERLLFGALAVDRTNGFYYGWAYDHPSLADAEKRAVDECTRKGGDCSVVLTFSGTGCAAYRTIDGKVGTAFGWGLARTREEADEIAKRECMKRSKGTFPSNYVWSCNSTTKTPLKELYNAKDEISDIVDNTPLGATFSAAFSADGKRFAAGSEDGTIRVWSMPSFSLIAKFATAPADMSNRGKNVKELLFSHDGKYIIAGHGTSFGKVKVWEALSGRLVRELSKTWGGDPALSISPDGKYLAYGGDCVVNGNGNLCPTTAYIYDTDTWGLVKTLTGGHDGTLNASCFSPDGRTLATAGVDGNVVLWNAATGSIKRTLNVTSDQVGDAMFSPDGRTLITITWSEDATIKHWDAATGSLLKTLPGHGAFGHAVSFYNSNSKVVSTGSFGGRNSDSLIIWDLNTGSKISSVKLYYTDDNLCISPDNIIITTGIGGLEMWKADQQGVLKMVKKLE